MAGLKALAGKRAKAPVSGGGGGVKDRSVAADSAAAMASSARANATTGVGVRQHDAHLKASGMHDLAAFSARKAGDEKTAVFHEQKSAEHMAAMTAANPSSAVKGSRSKGLATMAAAKGPSSSASSKKVPATAKGGPPPAISEAYSTAAAHARYKSAQVADKSGSEKDAAHYDAAHAHEGAAAIARAGGYHEQAQMHEKLAAQHWEGQKMVGETLEKRSPVDVSKDATFHAATLSGVAARQTGSAKDFAHLMAAHAHEGAAALARENGLTSTAKMHDAKAKEHREGAMTAREKESLRTSRGKGVGALAKSSGSGEFDESKHPRDNTGKFA